MKLSDQFLRKPLFVAFGQALQGGGITSVDLVAVRDATTVTLTASDGSAAPIAGADASTAGVMTAADKFKLDGLSAATTQGFPSRSDVAAAVIDAGVSHVRTAGNSTADDGGGALYKRVGSAPAHNLKVQSADLAWWELVPDSHGYINVKQAGAVGDNITNDGQAFKDALAFASLNATSFDNATYGVIVPPSATPYYLGANTLELKATVHLVGQGAGQAGGNPTGIIVHRANTIGAGKEVDPTTLSASGTKIEGLWLESDGGTIAGVADDTKGHGIWLRARAVLIDLVIRGFPGNGVNIVATAGSGDAAREGNANNWYLERARIVGCHQNGIFTDGGDVNAGGAENVDVTGNGRWGIFDGSFLGNTYVGCHAAGNGTASTGENGAGGSSYVHLSGRLYGANVGATEAQLVATTPGTDGAVWYDIKAGSSSSTIPTWLAAQPTGTYFHGGPYHSDNANATNVFTGCYSEGDQGPSQWVKPTTVFGGFIGQFRGTAIVHYNEAISGKIEFRNHERWTPSRDLTLTINSGTDKLLNFLANGDQSAGVNIIAWNETDGQVMIGQHSNLTARVPIRFTTDLNAAKHGRATAQAGGEMYLYKGFWIGQGSGLARFFRGFTVKPTSGDVARGDTYWNYNPASAGEVAGWRIITSGTVGSTAVLEEYFYLPDLPGDHPGYNIRPKADGSNKVQWRAAAKAGTDTIVDTASTVAVTFTTAFASANYAVALSANGDERVWVTLKTPTGFTLNRLATSGARAIDWTVTPHEDL